MSEEHRSSLSRGALVGVFMRSGRVLVIPEACLGPGDLLPKGSFPPTSERRPHCSLCAPEPRGVFTGRCLLQSPGPGRARRQPPGPMSQPPWSPLQWPIQFWWSHKECWERAGLGTSGSSAGLLPGGCQDPSPQEMSRRWLPWALPGSASSPGFAKPRGHPATAGVCGGPGKASLQKQPWPPRRTQTGAARAWGSPSVCPSS